MASKADLIKSGKWLVLANKIADKLSEYPLDPNESRLLWHVIRYTWGMKGQEWGILKWKFMKEKTKLRDSALGYARAKLKARNILFIKPATKPKELTYKINSRTNTWILIKNIPQEAYHPRKLLQRVGVNKPVELLQPVGASYSNGLEQPLQPVGVIPIKRKILNTEFKNKTENVCVLTPKEMIFEDAKTILDCLNELSGKEFTYTEENLDPIVERLTAGATIDQCMKICFNKWEDTTFQNQFYRPSTLFKEKLFEGYLNSKGTKFKPASKQEARRYHNAEVIYKRELERRENDQCNRHEED